MLESPVIPTLSLSLSVHPAPSLHTQMHWGGQGKGETKKRGREPDVFKT
jgi:hypothetical protein